MGCVGVCVDKEEKGMWMELGWKGEKKEMWDMKGKEREEEREGEMKNEMIDVEGSEVNYDVVESELNVYEGGKEGVDEVKCEKKGVEKNWVIS